MTGIVDITLVSRTLQRLLEQSGRSILYDCRASRRTLSYAPDSAAAPTGLLPAFLSAGDAVWREATGKSLGVEIAADPNTVLGFTVRGVHAGTFATIMLSVMEAIEQAAQPSTLLVNDLARVWREAEDRISRARPGGTSGGSSMRLGAIVALALALLPALGRAAAPAPVTVASCIEAAAMVHHLPSAVVLILLSVEGGALGQVSPNTNNTVDIGPMQVNTIWVPVVASHWRATPADTYVALRDNFCANVEAGTWILRQAIDEAHGDFWEGVGFYHSHDPGYKADYLRKVLRQTLRLQAQALRQTAATPPDPAGS